MLPRRTHIRKNAAADACVRQIQRIEEAHQPFVARDFMQNFVKEGVSITACNESMQVSVKVVRDLQEDRRHRQVYWEQSEFCWVAIGKVS